MNSCFLQSCFFFTVVTTSVPAAATDFYGATVNDRDVPTVAWKARITGFRPIVSNVLIDSIAANLGFKQGDIILSVNDKDVSKSLELSRFTTDKLSVCVFNGTEKKIFIIDRLAIETEKNKLIAANRKSILPLIKPIAERQDNSPPLVFNDYALEMKFGKSAPVSSAGLNNGKGKNLNIDTNIGSCRNKIMHHNVQMGGAMDPNPRRGRSSNFKESSGVDCVSACQNSLYYQQSNVRDSDSFMEHICYHNNKVILDDFIKINPLTDSNGKRISR